MTVKKNDKNIIKILLKTRFNLVLIILKLKSTLLHSAVYFKYLNILKLFLKDSANIFIKNNMRQMALYYIIIDNHLNIAYIFF